MTSLRHHFQFINFLRICVHEKSLKCMEVQMRHWNIQGKLFVSGSWIVLWGKHMEDNHKWKYNYCTELKTLWRKGEICKLWSIFPCPTRIQLNYVEHISKAANCRNFIACRLTTAIRRLCSRRLSENIVTKEEQFLLLTQCFPLLVIGYPFN